MNVAWAHYEAVASGAPGTSMPAHRGWLRSAFYLWQGLERHLHVVDIPEEPCHPKMVLHFCPPQLFTPIQGKVNVCFSMYEGGALPPEMVLRLRRADWCIVPSRYNQEVWRNHGLDAAVVPLGVPEPYVTCDHSRRVLTGSDRVLRFLWVGSTLGRKGWELLMPAWSHVFRPADPAQLYCKTIAIGQQGVQKHYGERIIVDTRDLSEEEMLELYLSADVFLFPSLGEGFGLPALEAMASGCLVVAPQITGLTEFVEPYTAVTIALSQPVVAEYGAKYVTRFPTIEGLAMALRRVVLGWGTAPIESIRRTGTKHARKFTWAASAARLAEVLRVIAEKNGLPVEEGVLVH